MPALLICRFARWVGIIRLPRIGPPGAKLTGEGTARDGFTERSGFVEHPLLTPGTHPWSDGEVSAARQAVRHPTLCIAGSASAAWDVALLVVADRLRGAGGMALALLPGAGEVRQLAARLEGALAGADPTRVVALVGSVAAPKRKAAWSGAWVVCTTAERALLDAHGGVADLSRCSLLIIDRAERAVGSPVYSELLREVRRARPKALVLGTSHAPPSDRRRTAALMEALGLRQLHLVSGRASETGPPPQGPRVVRVEMPAGYVRLQAALEAELAPRLARLSSLGLLPAVEPSFVTRGALIEASARVRAGRASEGGASVEAMRVHAQALLLLEACELLECHGAELLADFLERLGATGGGAPAERALAATPTLLEAARSARRLCDHPGPKEEKLKALLNDRFLEQPGSKVVVVAKYGKTAQALRRRLASPPPVGLGIKVSAGGGEPAAITVATSAEADPQAISGADLVMYHDASSFALSGFPAKGAPASVVLVASGGREEAWIHEPAGGGHRALAGPALRARTAPGTQRLIEEFRSPRGPAGGAP